MGKKNRVDTEIILILFIVCTTKLKHICNTFLYSYKWKDFGKYYYANE